MEKYIYIKEIGRGTFGRVCLMRNVELNRYEAIKFVHKSKSKYVFNEIKNHITCAYHSNIIQFNTIIFTEDFICLSIEYADKGDLFEYMKTLPNRKFSEELAKPIFKQILSGIAHCHSLGIMHRDIKLENVLMNESGYVKICDFGYATEVKEFDSKHIRGTLSYLAPECILQKVEDCTKIDVWSCGVVLFCMLCGFYPFQDPADPSDVKKTYRNIYHAKCMFPSHLSQEATHLLKTIFNVDPSQRPSTVELMGHIWFI